MKAKSIEEIINSNLISLILPLIIEFMIIINMIKLIKAQKIS